MENNYSKIAAIDVGAHIEKKNGLSYLSWVWAVDQLMRLDPAAEWEYGEPRLFGKTMMVFCTVRAFGKSRTAQLPVMDHRNKAIADPDAFAVNNAMQRCLVKAIALHGLGLYIYAGEDLPPEDSSPQEPQTLTIDQCAEIVERVKESGADFQGLLQWISKGAGYEVTALDQAPAAAYEPIVKRLKAKKAPAAA